MRKASLIALTLLAATLPAPAQSAPPTLQVHGIDLLTVIRLDDHLRAANLQRDIQKRGIKVERLRRIKTVVLDPGHGGENEGAHGVAGIHEKKLTLELAIELRKKLQARFPHLRVLLTRYDDRDIELDDRVAFANRHKADLFLSLHYNAASHERALGVETYYLSEGFPKSVREQKREACKKNEKGKVHDPKLCARLSKDPYQRKPHKQADELATIVQSQLLKHTGALNRGVKRASFGVLRGAKMPAVVVESGFLSHPVEGKKIVTKKHRAKICDALVTAIRNFDKNVGKPKPKKDKAKEPPHDRTPRRTKP